MVIVYNSGLRPREGAANGIPFDTFLVSMWGVEVVLFPTRGVHSQEEVSQAKRELRDSRDVVYFNVVWQPGDSS